MKQPASLMPHCWTCLVNKLIESITIVIIASLAVAYTFISIFLQRKLSNPKRIAEIQGIIKENSARLKELTKQGASTEEIMAKQKEVLPLMTETMKYQFKPMLIIMPLFLLLYYLVVPSLASTFKMSSSVHLMSFNFSNMNFFFVITFVLGLIVSVTFMIYDRRARKKVIISNSQKISG